MALGLLYRDTKGKPVMFGVPLLDSWAGMRVSLYFCHPSTEAERFPQLASFQLFRVSFPAQEILAMGTSGRQGEWLDRDVFTEHSKRGKWEERSVTSVLLLWRLCSTPTHWAGLFAAAP